MKEIIRKRSAWLGIFTCLFLIAAVYFAVSEISVLRYVAQSNSETAMQNIPEIFQKPSAEGNIAVVHIGTPIPLKAVYMSSWTAGTPSFKNKIIEMIKRTELNAAVIDVKDYTGRISFSVLDPELAEIGSAENRIKNIKGFISELHQNNIYAIARIAVFQDPYLAKKWKEYAVTKLSDKNALWQDDKCKRAIAKNQEKNCTYWLDMGAEKVWDYIIAIGREAYSVGFDELNFDYIRFPSDGNMKDIYFPVSNDKVKKEVMRDFFKYLHDRLAGAENEINPRPKLSADLFGMTMTNTDDLNIGQQLEYDAPYFDYISPMVYPSHFPPSWNGFDNPAAKPYEVVKIAMDKGIARLREANEDQNKIRPWLQDFNLGAVYTKEMVQAQIKAAYDAGLDSWMLWDPGNTYTESALLPE